MEGLLVLALELEEVELPLKAVLAAVSGFYKEDLAGQCSYFIRRSYSLICRGDCCTFSCFMQHLKHSRAGRVSGTKYGFLEFLNFLLWYRCY